MLNQLKIYKMLYDAQSLVEDERKNAEKEGRKEESKELEEVYQSISEAMNLLDDVNEIREGEREMS